MNEVTLILGVGEQVYVVFGAYLFNPPSLRRALPPRLSKAHRAESISLVYKDGLEVSHFTAPEKSPTTPISLGHEQAGDKNKMDIALAHLNGNN